MYETIVGIYIYIHIIFLRCLKMGGAVSNNTCFQINHTVFLMYFPNSAGDNQLSREGPWTKACKRRNA